MNSHPFQVSQDALVIWSLPAAALYLVRAGDSSVYIFDLFFLLILVIGNGSVPAYLFRAMVLFAVCFLVSLFAVTAVAVTGGTFAFGDFVAPFIRYGELIMMMCYFSRAAQGTTVSPHTLRNFVIISAFIPLVLGLILFYIEDPSVTVFNRYAGYLTNPNYMAAYVAVMLPVVLVCTTGYQTIIRYALIAGYLVVGIYSLILAGSNGGWIAFTATGLIYFATSSRRSFLLIGVIGALLVIFANEVNDLVRAAAHQLTESDFQGLRRTGRLILIVLTVGDFSTLGSLDFRESVQTHLIDEFIESPFTVLFGFGMGHAKWITFEDIGQTVAAHNGYINTALELGVIGTVFLSASLGYAMLTLRPNINTFRLCAGYLLALGTTPALYLPFFWMPVLGAAALDLYTARPGPRATSPPATRRA